MKKPNHKLVFRVEQITPKKAKAFLDSMVANRNPSGPKVVQYSVDMERGAWDLNGEPIIISSEGKMIDGQQRCLACIRCNTAFWSLVVRGVDPDYFRNIDQGPKRTPGNLFQIHGIKDGNAIASACRWFNNLCANTPPKSKFRKFFDPLLRYGASQPVVDYFMDPKRDMLRKASDWALHGKNLKFCKGLPPRAVAMAMHAIGTIAENGDSEFIEDYLCQVYVEPVDRIPRMIRDRMLMDAARAGMGSSGRARSTVPIITAAAQAKLLLYGWNWWVTDHKMTSIVIKDTVFFHPDRHYRIFSSGQRFTSTITASAKAAKATAENRKKRRKAS